MEDGTSNDNVVVSSSGLVGHQNVTLSSISAIGSQAAILEGRQHQQPILIALAEPGSVLGRSPIVSATGATHNHHHHPQQQLHHHHPAVVVHSVNNNNSSSSGNISGTNNMISSSNNSTSGGSGSHGNPPAPSLGVHLTTSVNSTNLTHNIPPVGGNITSVTSMNLQQHQHTTGPVVTTTPSIQTAPQTQQHNVSISLTGANPINLHTASPLTSAPTGSSHSVSVNIPGSTTVSVGLAPPGAPGGGGSAGSNISLGPVSVPISLASAARTLTSLPSGTVTFRTINSNQPQRKFGFKKFRTFHSKYVICARFNCAKSSRDDLLRMHIGM